MQTVNDISALRSFVNEQKRQGKTIGFVPTMGNLHKGHITLIKEARKQTDIVVSSIFVNPTQFGEGEDFDSYPRTLESDSTQLAEAGCHLLFAPSTNAMYPAESSQWATVHISNITTRHCGAARAGHFDGVSTVVCKLFNLVTPDIAFFGKKDFQQLAVIRRMVEALCFNIQIVGVETVRETNGLAMSSRNGYLSEIEKQVAAILYQQLKNTRQHIISGNNDYATLAKQAQQALVNAGFNPEYFNICQADTLEPATVNDHSLVILAAAKLGKARLIDNIDFDK